MKKKSGVLFKLGTVLEYLHEIQTILELSVGPADVVRNLENQNTFMSGYLAACELVQDMESTKKLSDSDLISDWCNDTVLMMVEIRSLNIASSKECTNIINMLYNIPKDIDDLTLNNTAKNQSTTPERKRATVLPFTRNKEQTR